jgi:hypothetical protein
MTAKLEFAIHRLFLDISSKTPPVEDSEFLAPYTPNPCEAILSRSSSSGFALSWARHSQRPSPPQGGVASASIRRLVGKSYYSASTQREGRLVKKMAT